jgi:prefoldin subunit 5
LFVEKTPAEAIGVIDNRIQTLQTNQESLTTISQQINDQMDEISKKAQQLLSNKQ